LKYGGSSLATLDALRRVAKVAVARHRQGWRVVVVVSAMGETTDHLLEKVRALSPSPPHRELDILLATGEHVSMALLAMAIRGEGESAVALTGAQCGICTNEVHNNARILEIRPRRITEELDRGRIVVAAGYQGVSATGEVTTLGRGGSDTTAVALAAALDAGACEIYTDVDGIYSADPRRVPEARKLAEIGGREMQALAWHGAQVVKAEAVDFARGNGVEVRVRSSATEDGGSGTLIRSEEPAAGEVYVPRQPALVGVAGRKDLLQVRLPPGEHDGFFELLAPYDLVFGGLRQGGEGTELFLSDREVAEPREFCQELTGRFPGVAVHGGLGAVSLIGFGVGSRPATFHEAVTALRSKTRVLASFTSEDSISFVVDASRVDEGVRWLHRIFITQEAAHPPGDNPSPGRESR
jgi:aspartate kinase